MLLVLLWNGNDYPVTDYVLDIDDNLSMMMVCFVFCITIFSAERKNASDYRQAVLW